MNEEMEMTFTIEDADLDKLYDVVKEINVMECPWFEVQDKHGNKAKYYREPHWIPCTERLPEDEDYDETFTVTIQCEHYDGRDDYVTGYADWTPHGWDIESYYLGQIKVMAWMPRPEPYQPNEDES